MVDISNYLLPTNSSEVLNRDVGHHFRSFRGTLNPDPSRVRNRPQPATPEQEGSVEGNQGSQEAFGGESAL